MANWARSTHGQPRRNARHWRRVIKGILTKTRWSIPVLAEHAGINHQTIRNITRGAVSNIHSRHAELLEKVQSEILATPQHPQDTFEEHAQSDGDHKTQSEHVPNGKPMFKVAGPFEIPSETRRGGTSLLGGSRWQAQFWNEVGNGIKDKKGVYVFAIKAGDSYGHIYVGKTTKGFGEECFKDHKMNKYREALPHYEECTPVMFFIQHPVQKGPVMGGRIKAIEDSLIVVADLAKPDLLLNKQKRKRDWSIQGFEGNSVSQEAQQLRDALGLSKTDTGE